MKTYKIQVRVLGLVDNQSAEVWADRGTIKGKSIPAILKRAYYQSFRGNFDAHPQSGTVLMHNKHRDRPVLRIVEVDTRSGLWGISAR